MLRWVLYEQRDLPAMRLALRSLHQRKDLPELLSNELPQDHQRIIGWKHQPLGDLCALHRKLRPVQKWAAVRGLLPRQLSGCRHAVRFMRKGLREMLLGRILPQMQWKLLLGCR